MLTHQRSKEEGGRRQSQAPLQVSLGKLPHLIASTAPCCFSARGELMPCVACLWQKPNVDQIFGGSPMRFQRFILTLAKKSGFWTPCCWLFRDERCPFCPIAACARHFNVCLKA